MTITSAPPEKVIAARIGVHADAVMRIIALPQHKLATLCLTTHPMVHEKTGRLIPSQGFQVPDPKLLFEFLKSFYEGGDDNGAS